MIYKDKYDHLSEKEHPIIHGCITGNRAYQEKLYNLYTPKMLIICQRYAKNRDEANEILQEGFYRIFKNIHQFKNTGSLEGWIRKIIVNVAIQKYKSRSNLHLVIPIESTVSTISDKDDIYSKLSFKEIILLVQQLPTSYRMVFNLYVFEGYKHREIAEILGIAEGTSKSNLSDARMLLQKNLQKNNTIKIKMIR